MKPLWSWNIQTKPKVWKIQHNLRNKTCFHTWELLPVKLKNACRFSTLCIVGMIMRWEGRSTLTNPVPMPTCPPQTTHVSIWNWVRVSMVGGRRLIATVRGRPNKMPQFYTRIWKSLNDLWFYFLRSHTGHLRNTKVKFCYSRNLRSTSRITDQWSRAT
jgi:hypothetical protein